MDDAPSDGSSELTPRPPQREDFVRICRELNRLGARYVVVGGFAVIEAGYPRTTGDIDLLVDSSPENEAKVFEALMILADGCVRDLEPGDLERFTVVRVADEVLVDLMASASGINYQEAEGYTHFREIDGERIPFATPELLWRMKRHTHRAKDQGDLVFLRALFAAEGRQPPD